MQVVHFRINVLIWFDDRFILHCEISNFKVYFTFRWSDKLLEYIKFTVRVSLIHIWWSDKLFVYIYLKKHNLDVNRIMFIQTDQNTNFMFWTDMFRHRHVCLTGHRTAVGRIYWSRVKYLSAKGSNKDHANVYKEYNLALIYIEQKHIVKPARCT